MISDDTEDLVESMAQGACGQAFHISLKQEASDECWNSLDFPSLTLWFNLGPPSYGMVPSIFKVGLSSQVCVNTQATGSSSPVSLATNLNLQDYIVSSKPTWEAS